MPARDGGPTREEVALALFARAPLALDPRNGQPVFTWTSRRLMEWDQIPSKPALCQTAFDEEFSSNAGGPIKRIWGFEWWLFHAAGDGDDSAIPNVTTNMLLDAVEVALSPLPHENLLDLGGLVHSVRISGRVVKVDGDLNGQALITVPISVWVP